MSPRVLHYYYYYYYYYNSRSFSNVLQLFQHQYVCKEDEQYGSVLSRIGGEHEVEGGQRQPTNAFTGSINANARVMLLQLFAKYDIVNW
jgi:hypothetical protein